MNTIHKTPLGISDADSVFNWAESQFSILFPEHQQSHDIFGYYAHAYTNGDAIGVKDDNIYFMMEEATELALLSWLVPYQNIFLRQYQQGSKIKRLNAPKR